MLYHIVAETTAIRDFTVFADSAAEARAKAAAFLFSDMEDKPLFRESIHPDVVENHKVHILSSMPVGFEGYNHEGFRGDDDDDYEPGEYFSD